MRLGRAVAVGVLVALVWATTGMAASITAVDPSNSTELLIEFECGSGESPRFVDELNSFDETFAAGTDQLVYDIGDIVALGRIDTIVFTDCTPRDGDDSSVDCFEVAPIGNPNDDSTELTVGVLRPESCAQFLPLPNSTPPPGITTTDPAPITAVPGGTLPATGRADGVALGWIAALAVVIGGILVALARRRPAPQV